MARNAAPMTHAAAREYAVETREISPGTPYGAPDGVRSCTSTVSGSPPTTRADRSTLTLRPGSTVIPVRGVDSSLAAGSPTSPTPIVTDCSPSLAIVTGTRPESPEKITRPDDSTCTAAIRPVMPMLMSEISARPVAGCERHPVDCARRIDER